MEKVPIRCSKCNKLMFYISSDLKGKIEVKCTRCGNKETITR